MADEVKDNQLPKGNQDLPQGDGSKEITAEDLLKSKVQGITEDKVEEMVEQAITDMGMTRDEFVNMIQEGIAKVSDDAPSTLEGFIGRRLPILAVLSVLFLACLYFGKAESAATLLGMIGILVHGYFGDIKAENNAITASK